MSNQKQIQVSVPFSVVVANVCLRNRENTKLCFAGTRFHATSSCQDTAKRSRNISLQTISFCGAGSETTIIAVCLWDILFKC